MHINGCWIRPGKTIGVDDPTGGRRESGDQVRSLFNSATIRRYRVNRFNPGKRSARHQSLSAAYASGRKNTLNERYTRDLVAKRHCRYCVDGQSRNSITIRLTPGLCGLRNQIALKSDIPPIAADIAASTAGRAGRASRRICRASTPCVSDASRDERRAQRGWSGDR